MPTILPAMSLLPRPRSPFRAPMFFGAVTVAISLSAFGLFNRPDHITSTTSPASQGGEMRGVDGGPGQVPLEPGPTPTRVIAFGIEEPGALPVETLAPFSAAPARPTQPVTRASGTGGVRLFLPLVAYDYQPPPAPPRQAAAFTVLGPYSISDWASTTPEWISNSRIGLHAVTTGDSYAMEFIRRSKPRIVKAVGDYGWLREVKELSPYIVTQARIYGQDESWVNAIDPTEAAERYINEHLTEYQLNPYVDYWEGWNEFIYDSPDKLTWYAQFEAARACGMWDRGFRAAVGGFAVGWPNTYPEMELFIPALEAAYKCGGIFHLHEYNKPLMLCGVQTNVAGLIPGAPALRVPAGPLTLRYRYWYEGYLKPRGMGDLPLVISETGIDGVPAIGCTDAAGSRTWKDLRDWWPQNGYGVDAPNAYVSQLAWYDRELRQDDYVLGATLFTAGAAGGGDFWNSFDIHEVLIPLSHYVASQR